MYIFFLWDWINDYINTPKMQQTESQEILFYFALLIICSIAFGIVVSIARVSIKIDEHRNNKR